MRRKGVYCVAIRRLGYRLVNNRITRLLGITLNRDKEACVAADVGYAQPPPHVRGLARPPTNALEAAERVTAVNAGTLCARAYDPHLV
jgi:hypothetical protein